jgi:hypothetical protein
MSQKESKPLVSIVMGSQSDIETLKEAAAVLKDFAVPHELRVISADRTPDAAREFALSAEQLRTADILGIIDAVDAAGLQRPVSSGSRSGAARSGLSLRNVSPTDGGREMPKPCEPTFRPCTLDPDGATMILGWVTRFRTYRAWPWCRANRAGIAVSRAGIRVTGRAGSPGSGSLRAPRPDFRP